MVNTLIVQEGVGIRQTASLRVYEKLIYIDICGCYVCYKQTWKCTEYRWSCKYHWISKLTLM